MHPVLRRILLHGVLTAAVLALLGAMFAELASLWLTGNAPRGAPNADDHVRAALRSRVPLTLALWGFLFVLVGEVVIWRVRGNRPPAARSAEHPPDDAEKLLNELLTQAEAKMALEASGNGPGAPGPEEGTKPEEKPADPPAQLEPRP